MTQALRSCEESKEWQSDTEYFRAHRADVVSPRIA
jgi:hypothetical protein